MKTTLLPFLTTLFCSVMAVAQPVITLQDATPAFGTSLTMMSGMYASPGGEGADQTWNLGGMFADNATEMTFLSPEGLPGSELFPDATHVPFTGMIGEAYVYLSFDNNRLDELGYISSSVFASVETVYSDPKMQVQFPIQYGASFSDNYARETINEYTFEEETTVNTNIETGSYEAEVDGYGTLITPAGTYENVLRIIFEIEETFTVISEGEEVGAGERVSTEYQYFKAGYPVPLVTLTTTTFYSEGEEVDQFSSGSYLSSISVGLSEIDRSLTDVHLFPVPAQSHLNVSLELENAEQVHFSLISPAGKELHTWPVRHLSAGKQKVELTLPEVSEGIYLFRVQTDAGLTTRKLAVRR